MQQLAKALGIRGISLLYARDGREALAQLCERIPRGARVMNGGSATLEKIGFFSELGTGRYQWLRPAITAIDDREERIRARREAHVR